VIPHHAEKENSIFFLIEYKIKKIFAILRNKLKKKDKEWKIFFFLLTVIVCIQWLEFKLVHYLKYVLKL